MFFSVCLVCPSERTLKLVTHSGGSSDSTLKNEKGAQLLTPASLTVEIHAIGRGMTRPMRSLYRSVGVTSASLNSVATRQCETRVMKVARGRQAAARLRPGTP